MNLQWEPKVGPAAIVSVLGFLGVLIALGAMWGAMQSDVHAARSAAAEARNAAISVQAQGEQRDQRITAQAERLGRIETSLTFIIPALQRIENAIRAPR